MNHKKAILVVRIIGMIMGLGGILTIGYFFSWVLAIAIFFTIFGDNLSRAKI